MKIDLTAFIEKLDVLHWSLACVAVIELILLVILLSLIVIGLVRKSQRPAELAAKPEKPIEPLISTPPPETPKIQPRPAPEVATLREAKPDSALQLLGLLQQEARFIDFIEEDIQSYSDADIGAAARIVHEGCHKVVHNHFDLSPIRPESENSRVVINPGFDPSTVRLTGNIVGRAPFKGTLVHRGWQVTDTRLPKLAEHHNVRVVAAAEVEL